MSADPIREIVAAREAAIPTTGAPEENGAVATNVEPPSSWQPRNLLTLAADPPQPPTIIDLFYEESLHIVSN